MQEDFDNKAVRFIANTLSPVVPEWRWRKYKKEPQWRTGDLRSDVKSLEAAIPDSPAHSQTRLPTLLFGLKMGIPDHPLAYYSILTEGLLC